MDKTMGVVFTALLATLLAAGCFEQAGVIGPVDLESTTTSDAIVSAEETSTTATSPPETSTTPSSSTVTSSTTSTTTAPRGVQIKPETLTNCVGFVPGDWREIFEIRMIGAGWARPHPGPFAWGWIERSEGSYDFSQSDGWAKAAQSRDVAILATIWPYADWDQRMCHDDGCGVDETDIFYPRTRGGALEGIPRSRCMPCDMEAYSSFVQRLVERYDGDGIDDMPGLTQPITHWEIGNEPVLRSDELTFFKGSPQEYAQILKASYISVKAACPDCMVVQGGMEGIDPRFASYWDQVFKAGGGQYFDIGNIHYIDYGDLQNLNVGKYRELLEVNGLNKTIWVTEAEYSSDSQVDASVDGALKAGASKVFFTRFKVGDRGQPKPGVFSPVYLKQVRKCD
ncbi:MAG: hypothetical protein V1875_00300 [Candidatus Altiarchaeota archaeon]